MPNGGIALALNAQAPEIYRPNGKMPVYLEGIKLTYHDVMEFSKCYKLFSDLYHRKPFIKRIILIRNAKGGIGGLIDVTEYLPRKG